MYWGPHHLWGKGVGGKVGASWSWLPSLPAHSPHSQLTPSSLLPPSLLPSLQLAPSSLQPPSSLQLAPSSSSLPACSQLSPASQLTPSSLQPPISLSAVSQLTPACSQLTPTISWVQGARGQCGSKLDLAPITPLTLLPSLPSLPPHWTSLPMSNEQLSMYLGPHHLWGQGARGKGGSKRKLAPFTPRSLPPLPNPCCHSPHSQLAGPCSQCPMNSLLCIGVSRWGQGAS